MAKWNIAVCSLFILLFSLSACRDKTLLDEYDEWLGESENFDPFAEGCENGSYDFYDGEGDIDCGGNCEPCVFDTPCLNVNQDMFIQNSAETNYDAGTSSLNSDNELVYRFAESDGGLNSLTISIDSIALRSNQRRLETTEYYERASERKITMSFNSYFNGSFYANDSHEVFIEEKNNQSYLTFCNVEFYSFNGLDFIASGSFKLEN